MLIALAVGLILAASSAAEDAAPKAPDARVTGDPVIEGYSRLDRGDEATALAVLRAAVARESSSARYHHHLGALLGKMDRYEEALAELLKARELWAAGGASAADTLHTQDWIARMLQCLSRRDEAEREFRVVLNSTSPPSTFWNGALLGLAQIASERGFPEKSAALLETGLAACRRVPVNRLSCAEFMLDLARVLQERDGERSARLAIEGLDLLLNQTPEDAFPQKRVHVLLKALHELDRLGLRGCADLAAGELSRERPLMPEHWKVKTDKALAKRRQWR